MTWRRILGWFVGIASAQALLVAAGAFVFAWVGFYDVAATAGHWSTTRWLLHFGMRRSVAFHAPELPQPGLDDPTLISRGAAHFRSECQSCHGSPSGASSPVANAMTPPPPRLDEPVRRFSASELHWIVKNGIKMTAMPAWPAPERDDELWSMVAFLKALPAMKPDEYRQLATDAEQRPFPVQDKPEPRSARASHLASQCGNCHGADGEGRHGAFPKIAGLGFTYVALSLRDFRSGVRKSGFMQPVAAPMSDADILEAAAHFAGLDRQPIAAEHSDTHELEKGRAIAQPTASGHASAACLGCHLLDHETRNPEVPNLAAQYPGYLAQQLRLFRSGIRSGTLNARIMSRYARELSDADIDAVSNYIASLPSAARRE